MAHGLPRVSGDGPDAPDAVAVTNQATPRERGWTLGHVGLDWVVVGYPA